MSSGEPSLNRFMAGLSAFLCCAEVAFISASLAAWNPNFGLFWLLVDSFILGVSAGAFVWSLA